MFKMYAKVLIQVGLAVALYYALSSFIESDVTIVIVLVSIIFLIIIYGIMFLSKNPADLLELVCDYDKYDSKIEKHKDKNPSMYHLLKAYGLVHLGEFDQAKTEYALVSVSELGEDKYNLFIKTVIDLKFAFEEGKLDLFKGIHLKAIEEKVFENVELKNEIFKVHQHILEKNYKKAEETAKEVIPEAKKRLYVIELEYLLALSYYEQNKLDDCSAVCEFVVSKEFKLAYTDKCRVRFEKVNRK